MTNEKKALYEFINVWTNKHTGNTYNVIQYAINGFKTILTNEVQAKLHITDGNSKTGNCGAYGHSIGETCRHDCECFTKKKCYGMNGFYLFMSNQLYLAENLKYFRTYGPEGMRKAINETLAKKKYQAFRWFTVGDIVNMAFLQMMIDIAKDNPNIEFWAYTKKYLLVNAYCLKYGVNSIPSNLKIIFSHWLNEDGSYLEMLNPYEFPTSEFIPYGMEYLADNVTYICPCSDPNTFKTCINCDHPCYRLEHGQSMALLEHSTTVTKTRDALISKAHKAIKKALGIK